MSGGGKKGGGVPNIPTEGTRAENAASAYYRLVRRWPSNSQIWWAYKRPLEVGTQEPPKNYIEVFDPQIRLQVSTGNTPAPRGHYILPAFYQDRSAASGINGIPVETSGAYRPTATAFYAGRVFYAGVNTRGYNTNIYFSQIIERLEQVQYCYQSGDPTAETVRDLLPSDGGVIVIPEMAEVLALFTYGQALFVGASNGIWMIMGSEGVGFRANDYSVAKVSGTPFLSNISLVFVEGQPMWWNRSGIWTIQPGEMGMPQVVSLSEGTIKQFYDQIPVDSKYYAKGAYDPLLRRVQWLYRSTEPLDVVDNYQYDAILNYDIVSNAFWPYRTEDGPRVDVLGIFNIEGYASEELVDQVFVNDEEVLVGDEVIFYTRVRKQPVQSRFKYIVNVKDDTTGVPETPQVGPIPVSEVFVNTDQVLVNTDVVQVTL